MSRRNRHQRIDVTMNAGATTAEEIAEAVVATTTPDMTDIDALEREAEQHAQPTPLLVRATLLLAREVRLLRVGMPPPPTPPVRDVAAPERRS